MKLASEMTTQELEHAIWICSLGSVPVGGSVVECCCNISGVVIVKRQRGGENRPFFVNEEGLR